MPRFSILGLSLLVLVLAWGAPAGRALAAQDPAAPKPVEAEAPPPSAPAPAVHHGGGGHDEGTPNILSADVVLGISTLVVFLLLLFVLGKFAWGPLVKALHDREEQLERTVQETERARHESERLLAEHRSHMAQVADQVRALIEKAHRDAEATAADILKKAQAEAEAARDRAKSEIATARDQALIEIWGKAADLAVSVAGRVLERELSPADHRRLVDQAVHDLPAQPNGHGAKA
ncbi:MAG TPA: F0F1 ATP synthase subunit B [Isosphaeraceae bacterium]|jgi:F-type H+-transporting ATPase subunit b|nr:F0F1 ATP synthase subunit B [Isosphaeraceae bacterium]